MRIRALLLIASLLAIILASSALQVAGETREHDDPIDPDTTDQNWPDEPPALAEQNWPDTEGEEGVTG
jgi:hypothetical protein